MSDITILDRFTGVEIDAGKIANEITTSAVALATEARSSFVKPGTLSAEANMHLRQPKDSIMKSYLARLENLMSYYGVNSPKPPKRMSAVNNLSALSLSAYFDSVMKSIKDSIITYLRHCLSVHCFDGKSSRGVYFNVNIERIELSDQKFLLISKIVIGKTSKTKEGVKDNQFVYVFNEHGDCIEKDVIAHSMKHKFNDEKADLILGDIDILLERFNKGIATIKELAYTHTLDYKHDKLVEYRNNGRDNFIKKLGALSRMDGQDDGS